MATADDLRNVDSGLVRYWFEFEYETGSHVQEHRQLSRCGVTAFDLEDAKRIVIDRFFHDMPFPTIRFLIEDVDVSTIEGLGRYAPPIWRGIWYPEQTI
jgi:hypothetical protein